MTFVLQKFDFTNLSSILLVGFRWTKYSIEIERIR